MRKLCTIILLLLSASWARSQQGNTLTIPSSGAPAGTCSFQMFDNDTTNGNLYFCDQTGHWKAVGGGGAGNPSLPLTSIQFNDGGIFGGNAGLTFNKTTQLIGGLGGVIIDPSATPLPTPTITSVTPQTAGGGITYGYKLQALKGNLSTDGSPEVTTNDGEDNLSFAPHANVIVWPAQVGATSCLVYRTTAGGSVTNTTGVIATLTPCGTGYTDIGAVGDGGSPFTTNSTGIFGASGAWIGDLDSTLSPDIQNWTPPPSILTVEKSYAGQVTGIASTVESTSGYGAFGIIGLALATGTVHNAVGVEAYGYSKPGVGETADTAIGYSMPEVANIGDGTLTDAFGVDVYAIGNWGAGTITNAYAYNCRQGVFTGGTIDTSACVHIGDQSTSIATNKYGILQEGAGTFYNRAEAMTSLGKLPTPVLTGAAAQGAGSLAAGNVYTSTLANGGAGGATPYAGGNTFTVNGGAPLAVGVVDTVDGAGKVLTYHFTGVGDGYTVAAGVATTATSGIGVGLTINVTAVGTHSWCMDYYNVEYVGNGDVSPYLGQTKCSNVVSYTVVNPAVDGKVRVARTPTIYDYDLLQDTSPTLDVYRDDGLGLGVIGNALNAVAYFDDDGTTPPALATKPYPVDGSYNLAIDPVTGTGEWTGVETQISMKHLNLDAVKLELQAPKGASTGIYTTNFSHYEIPGSYAWPLAGTGIPFELFATDLTGQKAAISSLDPTGAVGLPTGNGGYYEISWNAKVTTVAGTSSVLGGATGMTVTYTDADDSVVVTTPCNAGYNSTTAALNTTQAQISGGCSIHVKDTTGILYNFGYTSVNGGGADMAYSFYARLEAM